MEENRQRIFILDEIRGGAVICMVFYHTMYTLAHIFGVSFAFDVINFFEPIDPYFGGIFILISGIVSMLSKSNTKRGLKLAFVAAAVTLVTYFFIPESIIIFGVLHFLSFAMIYFGLTAKLREKIPTAAGIILCAFLTFATAFVEKGKFLFFSLPHSLYKNDFLCPFGIFSETFFSADYFPIFPWIFVFLFGTYLGRFARAGKFPKFMYKSRIPAFSFIGKHALLIYIVHQPVIFAISFIILRIFGQS